MAVIELPPAAALDQGLQGFAKRDPDGSLPDAGNELLRFWNAAPEHARALLQHHFELWLGSSLAPRLTELIRLAVANQTRCPVCLAIRNPRASAGGVDERLVTAIPHAETDPRFTEAERAAIDYAGRLAGDHLSISSVTFERLRACFSDREMAEITMLASSFLGMGRVLETLTADQPCPVPGAG